MWAAVHSLIHVSVHIVAHGAGGRKWNFDQNWARRCFAPRLQRGIDLCDDWRVTRTQPPTLYTSTSESRSMVGSLADATSHSSRTDTELQYECFVLPGRGRLRRAGRPAQHGLAGVIFLEGLTSWRDVVASAFQDHAKQKTASKRMWHAIAQDRILSRSSARYHSRLLPIAEPLPLVRCVKTSTRLPERCCSACSAAILRTYLGGLE